MAVIAVDVGGTTMKGAVVDATGPRLRARFPSRREAGPDAVVAAIVAAAHHLAAEAKAAGSVVDAAGVVVPGLVDEAEGIARSSANLGWVDIPLRRLIEDSLQVPVGFAHDVRAGGMAEAALGAAAGTTSALFVPIGTGISAALLVDGHVLSGAAGQAGELGQVPVEAPDGGLGWITLEEVASAPAIAARYERTAGRVPGSVDTQEVLAALAHGDPDASAVWELALMRLVDVLATAVAVFDPEVVVMGGGLSLAGEVLLGPVRAGLAKRLAWRRSPRVVPARFGDESGLVGAAMLGHTAAGRRLERWT